MSISVSFSSSAASRRAMASSRSFESAAILMSRLSMRWAARANFCSRSCESNGGSSDIPWGRFACVLLLGCLAGSGLRDRGAVQKEIVDAIAVSFSRHSTRIPARSRHVPACGRRYANVSRGRYFGIAGRRMALWRLRRVGSIRHCSRGSRALRAPSHADGKSDSRRLRLLPGQAEVAQRSRTNVTGAIRS